MVSYRVGVDVGGTFTDIVLLGTDGTIHTKKVSSSVENYAHAIVEGLSEVLRETQLAPEAIEELRHGTTVASNAILEHKGARTGLITTKGFRDVLEIRTLRMPRMYDIGWAKPAPLVERSLRKGLDEAGVRARLLLMQSNGGLTTDAASVERPIHIIESGPAGGVVGAQALARAKRLPKIITFDMGGTTAKAAMVEDGEVTRAQEYSVGAGIMIGSRLLTGAGYALKVPAIDLAEVGAGGGSLVWIDAAGPQQVGPESARPSPGPVCYDKGGETPTVTDANLVLGYINPAYLVGGALKLNAARARDVFTKKIVKPLGMSLERAAHGAHLIAASNMIRAIKSVSSERGRDPREFA